MFGINAKDFLIKGDKDEKTDFNVIAQHTGNHFARLARNVAFPIRFRAKSYDSRIRL